jgi:hypothetical protein
MSVGENENENAREDKQREREGKNKKTIIKQRNRPNRKTEKK